MPDGKPTENKGLIKTSKRALIRDSQRKDFVPLRTEVLVNSVSL